MNTPQIDDAALEAAYDVFSETWASTKICLKKAITAYLNHKPSMEWMPIESRPSELNMTYLVTNEKGQVAPWIRGIIHNNVGTAWDWDFGSAITHWMPLPSPPSEEK